MISPRYSRRTYEDVAMIMHKSKKKKEAIQSFAHLFASDNPRFEEQRFLSAVTSGKIDRRRKARRD